MDLAQIRRLVIIALFSDDALLEQLVLKGGNAVSLVYGLGHRASLDIDVSIDGDFENVDDTKGRIFQSLRRHFGSVGWGVFDERFDRRPAESGNEQSKWGGYFAEFKLIEKKRYEELGGGLEDWRRNAIVIGPSQQRIFRVELSKHEFCAGKTEVEMDDYAVYVYTPEMIAIEKLRAICQQMPEYEKRGRKTARARDFYDIHTLVTKVGIDLSLPENRDLCLNIFAAKDVPVNLIPKISEVREFHRPDWPAVEASVTGALESFDYYFDFVVGQTLLLKPLWVI